MDALTNIGAWLWGGSVPALLVKAMVFDVTTGLILATKEKRLSSSVGGDGMRRKATILLLVCLGFVLQPYATSQGLGVNLADLLAGAFLIVELISIFENAGRIGVRVPKIIRDVLAKLNEQYGEAKPKEGDQ